jgi:hypothetical protein
MEGVGKFFSKENVGNVTHVLNQPRPSQKIRESAVYFLAL